MIKSLLSPFAAPFRPIWKDENESDFIIYNNGVPIMIPKSERDTHQIVVGLSDEAIEEHFPLSADEAAELEATDNFVKTLAVLSLLEESEAHARQTFSHLEKRWEKRREGGLIGKPLPPRFVLDASLSAGGLPVSVEHSMVKLESHHLKLQALERRDKAREIRNRSEPQPRV
eukprot:CAMPEP_0118698702 /NCGR_PEP_ID=MMETSP0800-20121206/15378_1 /TAXON_ID=210618 ORGANISM="Striatella unipunctata, Strain CCMP2910" /NCGR_SAMPLE_ID=MMETSP0800 /ASSEMBLY_ACC=CAM_ASM_000638 /LENGTH=171 /DNA_ID=CAMNT_0006598613 /DNA_START=83 /DNA_END=595 /DNA_ORIENTATION=+